MTREELMKQEWYLYNGKNKKMEYQHKDYLHNAKLSLLKYDGDEKEHAHCEFCWNKFSMCPGDLQAGYYEPTSRSWICPECYREFSEMFGWVVSEM